MTDSPHNPVDKAVDILVFAPLGVAMFAKETVPTFLKMFVARGHTELEHRRKELRDQANQYRTIGHLAVKYGGPEVRRQAEATVDGVRRKAQESLAGLTTREQPAPSEAPTPRPERSVATHPAPAPRPEPSAGNGRASAALAIPDYDQLSASQVVARLDGLAPDELRTIRAYESEHRGRNTILGKIAQLTG